MRKQTTKRSSAVWPLAVGTLVLTPTVLKAVQVDLASGNSGEINGALFVWTDNQPTGTGYIDSFVRIQGPANGGVEQGYNTSGRPFAFDEKDPVNFTHDLQMRDLGSGVNVNGVEYYQFLLDVNEAGGNKSLISLDSLQLYTSETGSKTTADVRSLGTLRYDMGDNWVLLDASRNSGSGSGDMFAYIPKSLFAGAADEDYLYLYSKFGMADDAESEAGFEEWAYVRTEGGGTTGGTTGGPAGGGTTGETTGGSSGGTTGGPAGGGTTGESTGGGAGGGGTTGGGPSPVPEPSTYALLGSFLAFAGWMKFRNNKSSAA